MLNPRYHRNIIAMITIITMVIYVGVYRCKAVNKLGSSEAVVVLKGQRVSKRGRWLLIDKEDPYYFRLLFCCCS